MWGAEFAALGSSLTGEQVRWMLSGAGASEIEAIRMTTENIRSIPLGDEWRITARLGKDQILLQPARDTVETFRHTRLSMQRTTCSGDFAKRFGK
jgi:hypothetical protein